MVQRLVWLWCALAIIMMSGVLPGCGYSEDQWQGKLREVNSLKAQLQAERDGHPKAQEDYNAAKSEIEQLKGQLQQAGVDVQQLNASLAEQRKALEEFKRRAEQLEAIRQRFELLRNKLNSLTKLGLSVSVRKNRMVISMPGDVLFDTGRTDLKKNARAILAQVAEVIRGDAQLNERTFQVAGHTDNRPLRGGAFPDNWALSLMRAREVLLYLVDPKGGGLNPARWSAAGYGDTDPVAPNTTPEEMTKNRRVELIVLPNVEEMLDLKSLAH